MNKEEEEIQNVEESKQEEEDDHNESQNGKAKASGEVEEGEDHEDQEDPENPSFDFILNDSVEEIIQTEDADRKSVYIKNVDYMTTKEELIEHFNVCGTITRVTICTDKFTGNPKGFAYIEFAEVDGVENAKMLSDSLLRGRKISVLPKRTNVPFRGKRGMRRPRGMFYGNRGGFYGGRGGYSMYSGPSRGVRRGYKPF